MRKCLLISLLLIGCAGPQIPIHEHILCNVAGIFQAGMDCATDQTSTISELNFSQMIDFLEAQPERPDPDHPGKTLPARAGAICEPDDDFTDLKTALEQACVELKDRCAPQIKTVLAKASAAQNRIHAAAKKRMSP